MITLFALAAFRALDRADAMPGIGQLIDSACHAIGSTT